MKAQKWDFENKKYNDYETPKLASMYETDMSMIIECAECGKPALFGKCYTSRAIHNQHGMAYSVCLNCYQEERRIEKLHDDIKNKNNRI